ncbi:ABC transporter ATP-binding protein [Anaeromyxobacter paludicola]|uniref:Nitrate ABC transporter ATP-binding protein n=1 Tax=Anaeromyxobacter paludicola TaxID=2918171 RepID=A0ABM7X970_9BACT|nr:nitrate/sulfonate/bicarbonate ABC transporter ATP-binding protein [Anaeromyxobacter paludicola]BDG08394.1 nitrate ABC transporter ATP-binding protein [Anaeromyxobacter paludicola]
MAPETAAQAADPAALCALEHVTQEFPQPQGPPLRVLDDVSLSVGAGEVVALLGPSGCGKSTILRILAGLTRPTRGLVLDHGRPLAGLNPGVGFVFQSFALYPWMTVSENVEAVLEAKGLPRDELVARAEKAIRTVGLAGFEEAYPRELSGGMKQRVGMARAFSLEPELLFMDEPFSQVDALTAESLRAEVLDIFAAKGRHPSAILMVSHDIKEVVYMADRIVLLGANPGRVRQIVENRLPRPRDYRSPELLRLVDRLHDAITGAEMPDLPETAAGPAFEHIPSVHPGEVVGLLEYLDARGGREEVFRIANDTGREYGRTIAVVNAAELLDFVDTPKRMVSLAAGGRRFVTASPEARKAIWRERILALALFRQVHEALERKPSHRLEREFVLELLALHMPSENYDALFDVFVDWARFGDLFSYEEESGTLGL